MTYVNPFFASVTSAQISKLFGAPKAAATQTQAKSAAGSSLLTSSSAEKTVSNDAIAAIQALVKGGGLPNVELAAFNTSSTLMIRDLAGKLDALQSKDYHEPIALMGSKMGAEISKLANSDDIAIRWAARSLASRITSCDDTGVGVKSRAPGEPRFMNSISDTSIGLSQCVQSYISNRPDGVILDMAAHARNGDANAMDVDKQTSELHALMDHTTVFVGAKGGPGRGIDVWNRLGGAVFGAKFDPKHPPMNAGGLTIGDVSGVNVCMAIWPESAASSASMKTSISVSFGFSASVVGA
jgi:hypothetical protein